MMKYLTFMALVLNFNSYAGTLFPDHDINDPSLSKATVMLQCQKSLMYAPRQLEAWCEKAYELGYWSALQFIGLHTGDGSRYIAEARKHAQQGSPEGIIALAYAYKLGRFIDRDLQKSIVLFKRYLDEYGDVESEKMRVGSTHEELLAIYKELGNSEKVAEHKRYLEQSKYAEAKKAMFKRQLEEAGISLGEQNQ
ncbi:hypothetical protein W04_2123 [Pseudoalteromonas sp. SW0106-04]|uniref:hypothetical protein n=1 Tax=Pseudoalteromonas sp. SW0106-04 TaxID=1702169 RepID=UPI0006B5191F|nr:hypothetical protein [Pseudoalteromonas sp. SW0106-04]GAP75592.1 hypothetical protein W04_2123 [Pseudoalteromonas sp. SW0106-04]